MSGSPRFIPNLHSCLFHLGTVGWNVAARARSRTSPSLSPDPDGSRGQPIWPQNSLLEWTLDFMHCVSESITTKSPSQAISAAAARRRRWKMQVGEIKRARRFGISELYVDALFHELPVNFKAQHKCWWRFRTPVRWLDWMSVPVYSGKSSKCVCNISPDKIHETITVVSTKKPLNLLTDVEKNKCFYSSLVSFEVHVFPSYHLSITKIKGWKHGMNCLLNYICLALIWFII